MSHRHCVPCKCVHGVHSTKNKKRYSSFNLDKDPCLFRMVGGHLNDQMADGYTRMSDDTICSLAKLPGFLSKLPLSLLTSCDLPFGQKLSVNSLQTLVHSQVPQVPQVTKQPKLQRSRARYKTTKVNYKHPKISQALQSLNASLWNITAGQQPLPLKQLAPLLSSEHGGSACRSLPGLRHRAAVRGNVPPQWLSMVT